MDNNLTHKEQIQTIVTMGIIKDFILKIPEIIEKKKAYEKVREEYNKHKSDYNYCNWQIKNLYPKENIKYSGFRNPHAEIYSTQLPSNLNRILSERSILKFKIDRLYDRMRKAKSEYDDAFNLLVSYFNKYKEPELKYIMDYLDIEINSSEIANKGGALILESIIRDFEVLEMYQLQLPQDKPYRGTISLMETLVNQIKECETTIKKYNKYEERLEFLCDEYEDKHKLIKDKENRKNKLESFFINKLIKHEELEDLKFELKNLYLTLQNILTEFDLCINAANILLNEKSEMCLKCIKNKLCIDLILDRLGEKSLRELIDKLNIVIPKSDDNYFNEKEEMKKLIKKYFEEFEEKINNEINKEEEKTNDLSNVYWSKIDIPSAIGRLQINEKHLVKK